ncbi:MAG: hypothetical protein TREMPRED_002876 [Tremellales sp. Tagirdzhanova-0007]|nr:MAG: hypothetical protein TREMPRED_002876 [Tremellales sp. Tagirdzhanova-0007]
MINSFTALRRFALSSVVEPQYGGFFQYLTIIGLLVSAFLMIVAAFNDLLPAVKALKTLKRGLMLFAMPVEIVVASIYWPLVLFAPSLMFPSKPVDSATEPSSQTADLLFRIPLWMDLSMHAVPALVLLLGKSFHTTVPRYFFFVERRYTRPSSTVGAASLAVSFGTVYSLWVEYCATINGRFPYPFLNVMSPVQRVAMYVGSTIGALLTFWQLNALHR